MTSETVARLCRTCRWWTLRPAGTVGTCNRKPDGNGPVHRFWKIPMPGGGFAMADSWEPAETRPTETCHGWGNE